MSQDQPFTWKSSLSGPINWVGRSLWGLSKEGQAVLARLVESQIWHELAVSVALWVRQFRKGTKALAHLDARHFSSSLYNTAAFQAAIPVLELRGSESEYVSLCVASLRASAWDSRHFFNQINLH